MTEKPNHWLHLSYHYSILDRIVASGIQFLRFKSQLYYLVAVNMLGKPLNCSVPQFCHLKNRDILFIIPQVTGAGEIHEYVSVYKLLKTNLIHGKCHYYCVMKFI